MASNVNKLATKNTSIDKYVIEKYGAYKYSDKTSVRSVKSDFDKFLNGEENFDDFMACVDYVFQSSDVYLNENPHTLAIRNLITSAYSSDLKREFGKANFKNWLKFVRKNFTERKTAEEIPEDVLDSKVIDVIEDISDDVNNSFLRNEFDKFETKVIGLYRKAKGLDKNDEFTIDFEKRIMPRPDLKNNVELAAAIEDIKLEIEALEIFIKYLEGNENRIKSFLV